MVDYLSAFLLPVGISIAFATWFAQAVAVKEARRALIKALRAGRPMVEAIASARSALKRLPGGLPIHMT